jgi:hypothetical protein
MILAIYNNSEYSTVSKDDLSKAFLLPGDYFIFSYEINSHSNNITYKDPFTFYKNKNQHCNFRINNFELIDTTLVFIYYYSYKITFTIFNHIDKTTKQIVREGKYSSNLYSDELVFIVSTINLLGKTESWSELTKIEEIETMKKQIKILESEIKNLKKDIDSKQ